MKEILESKRDKLLQDYVQIESIFFDERTSDKDRQMTLRCFATHLNSVGDVNKKEMSHIQQAIDYVFKDVQMDNNPNLLAFHRKYSQMSEYFEDLSLNRNSREAIMLTLIDKMGKDKIVPFQTAQNGSKWISSIMAHERVDRFGWVVSKHGNPVVEPLPDMFPGLNWWMRGC